jgi:hypothetical protein
MFDDPNNSIVSILITKQIIHNHKSTFNVLLLLLEGLTQLLEQPVVFINLT